MKFKIILWISFSFLLSYGAYGQTSPGIYPPVLNDGCVNSSYLDTLRIVFRADTVVMGFTLPFDSIQTTGYANLPEGISATCLSNMCTAYPQVGELGTTNIIFSGVPTSSNVNHVITIFNTYYITSFGSSMPLEGSTEVNISINSSTTSVDTRTECNSLIWIDGKTYTESNNTATYTLSNAAGCDSVVTLDLTINTIDNTVSQNGNSLSANEIISGYQWLDCGNNNAILVGEINQSFTATENGNYAVEITKNNCIDTSACYSITSVGFIEKDFGDGLMFYTNPTDGNFSAKFKENQVSLSVRLITISGQVINTKSFQNTNTIQLDLNQPKGMYFLEISNGQTIKTVLRILKE